VDGESTSASGHRLDVEFAPRGALEAARRDAVGVPAQGTEKARQRGIPRLGKNGAFIAGSQFRLPPPSQRPRGPASTRAPFGPRSTNHPGFERSARKRCADFTLLPSGESELVSTV